MRLYSNGQWHGLWINDRFFCYKWDWEHGEDAEEMMDAARMRAEETRDFYWKSFVGRRVELTRPRGGKLNLPQHSGGSNVSTREVMGFTLTALSAFYLLSEPGYEAKLLTVLANKGTLAEDIRYLRRCVLFAQKLMERNLIVPDLEIGLKTGKAIWRPSFDLEEDLEHYYRLTEAMPASCLCYERRQEVDTAPTPEEVLFSFLTAVIDSLVREKMARDSGWNNFTFPAELEESRIAVQWWKALMSAKSSYTFSATTQEVEWLANEIQSWTKAYHPLRSPQATAELRLGVRLEPGPSELHAEDGVESYALWHLQLFMQPLDEPNLSIPAAEIWQEEWVETRWFHRRFRKIQDTFLKKLREAARLVPWLERALEESKPQVISLDTYEAYQFLQTEAWILQDHGVSVQLPNWWTQKGRKRLGMKLRFVSETDESYDQHYGAFVPSRVGLEQLLEFDAHAAVGNEPITLEELEELAGAQMPLVQFRGEWIELNREEVQQAIAYLSQRPRVEITLGELMHLAAEGSEGRAAFEGITVTDYELPTNLKHLIEGEWVQEMQLREIPSRLHGKLRSYQERGFQWLISMRELGFGVCLADDMGLGKTVQVIAMLLDPSAEIHKKRPNYGPALIICPTSLLGNWQKELARFAPDLNVMIHHGANREQGHHFVEQVQTYDVVLSTYNLVGRDEATFKQLRWSDVILDEAQNIKNEQAKQTQSILRLKSYHRVAVTGTPVENRLSELWSIFRFLNPGFLGTSAAFRSSFAIPIERDHDEVRTERLKRLVSPFVLRRVKTDPNISKDLPDKIETKTYCSLTKEQASLYQATVRQMLAQIEIASGIQRKGLVMASLTKLKQICNHPALFLQDKGNTGRRSGKMEQLLELVASIREAGEAVLVFTQYVKMGEILVDCLRMETGKTPLFLHGGIAKKDRDRMIESFQDPSGPDVFILSVKAGGVGLNLIRANHVIHFDRWWNPAVENQATDRAFRIGQTKNVQVHKFICLGTLEERIDEMIESKRALSEQVVGAGENWLTEMSTAHLRNLFEFREEALDEED